MNTHHIQAFQSGEQKDFDYFFRLHYKQLCFYTYFIVKSRAVAEDIVQDIFVKLWQLREQIRPATVKTLLYTMARNEAISWPRKQKTAGKKEEQYNAFYANETETDIQQHLITAETMKELYKALDTLPEGCRNVFEHLYQKGEKPKQAAAALQLSVNTVKTQRARGLKMLKQQLKLA